MEFDSTATLGALAKLPPFGKDKPILPGMQADVDILYGRQLIITTPNCCSARNTWKILQGYRPHFFMQYEKSRSPYRHNFEYDVHSARQLLEAAGFRIERLYTVDVFEEPVPQALDFLKRNHLPLDHRGDDIFMLATKAGPVVDRWPYGMYV